MSPTSPSAPDPAALAVLPRLAQLSNAVTRGRLAERAAEAAGLTLDRPATGVLLTLHTAGRALRIGEIADRMQVVGPHVTRQVQALERRGLVRRVGDPQDRRASLIEPTPEGAAAVDRYAGSLIGWFTETIGHWPEQDRADLGRLLGRLADDVTARLTALEETQDPPAR
ncbi:MULTISPECIES: MarR family winged helix-turn-helix transcriptional regulator [Streptomyces]|jgi:DNA-binding MarR family transcriptional regulator|uniref:MarR family transcriptional regulator n=1 Tax=Streptomyces doudnae TaxID=3075536 RepID=A0ABD5EI43_9ACTN|nr:MULTISPECIES: MarR family transcriptional regulator [unclassified Streptomyces]MDT0433965.1 MarR family transcriptional regulator [Streptomyces sp. DSM 41981]MYQ65602.1 MarR family transcriptional regulator [Streptomyces sp. SID4950]SCE03590.1 transcriptional regulator, MarR family [Streptomyces sp. SolWspMP-5a-2]